MYFGDNDGLLRALIQRAKDNGRGTITLAVAVGIDGRQNETGETLQKTNTSMLNFNYLFNPKEKTTLENDNNWDPDGAGPLTPSGSPYSCDGSTGAGLTNCPGRTLGDNSAGAFSPTLILAPEPSSAVLLGFGLMAAVGMLRRRK